MTIEIRPLAESDLPAADRIFRLAFGTFLGLPDPMSFAGDADFIGTRWRAAPDAALGAYRDGVLVGSNFAANWGSFGLFGPLTVDPHCEGQGIAQHLLSATMALFAQWGTTHAALFTFPQSAKHLALYQKFGFWPQQLTPVMAKPVAAGTPGPGWTSYASLAPDARTRARAACRALTDAIHPGLDLAREIQAVAAQQIGDTVLLDDGGGLAAFAICHLGGGSEAGSGAAFVKFGAAQPGRDAAGALDRLLAACEALAADRGLGQLIAGVNTARHDAYRLLIERGFKSFLVGVAMQRPNAHAFNRADCFVIDDWR